jgi:hypothetical protein
MVYARLLTSISFFNSGSYLLMNHPRYLTTTIS